MNNSLYVNGKAKSAIENIAASIFKITGFVSVGAVLLITIYMIYSGMPAFFKVGIKGILFNTNWAPDGANPSYGILYIILTSIIGTLLAILLALPTGILTAVALSEILNKKSAKMIKSAVELLAGIPSVVYGLLGILLINQPMYALEKFLFRNDPTHQYTGGCNLISAIIILAIMILPTLINITETSLQTISPDLRMSSSALGASKMQTIFKVVVPAAKNGIMSAIVLGTGRAIGEAMAILLVAGNSVNFPKLFNSVRFLTTAIASEMSYSTGLHREVLFSIGLVLFVFIMMINLLLSYVLRSEE